jgi:hypothetical protein
MGQFGLKVFQSFMEGAGKAGAQREGAREDDSGKPGE